MKQLYTKSDLVDVLGVSKQTVLRYLQHVPPCGRVFKNGRYYDAWSVVAAKELLHKGQTQPNIRQGNQAIAELLESNNSLVRRQRLLMAIVKTTLPQERFVETMTAAFPQDDFWRWYINPNEDTWSDNG